MTRARAVPAALTLALVLAACGRSPEVSQPEPADDLAVRPTFVTTPGTLAFVETAPYGPSGSGLFTAAFQNDGKYVAAGRSADNRFLVARYNTDGTLDTGFGSNGRVTTDFVGGFETAAAVRIQPDGKIVAAGSSTVSGQVQQFAIARYNPNGTPDASFDGDGKRTLRVGNGSSFANAVAVQTLGGQVKIVAAGRTAVGDEYRFATVRLNENGSLDTGFSGDGVAVGTAFGQAEAVGVQADGKVVVAGETTFPDPEGSSYRAGFTVVRYNTNGSQDVGFNAVADFGYSPIVFLNGLIVQPDGKIVAVGQTQTTSGNGGFGWEVVRFNANGSTDAAITIAEFTPNDNCDIGIGCGARDVAIQPDGKLVVGGYVDDFSDGCEGRFALARLNPDLSLDASFSGDGKLTTECGSTSDSLQRVKIAGNKIVAVGSSSSSAGTDFAVAKYFR